MKSQQPKQAQEVQQLLKAPKQESRLWTLFEQSEWLAQKQQMDRDLYVARQLQQSLLPQSIGEALFEEEEPYYFTKPHFKSEKTYITGFYNPCEALGGDLYDVFTTADSTVLVLSMVDVSGHGVAASLITAMSKAAIARICHQTHSPAEVLSHLNQEIQAIIHTGDYLTAWVGVYQQDSGLLTYARAGHPRPVLYRAQEKKLVELTEGGMIIGWLPDQHYEDSQIQLQAGDALLLYTDGASEMQNQAGEILGLEALKESFQAACFQPPENLPIRLDNLVLSLSDFSDGAPVGDDVSLLLLEVAKP